MRDRSDCVVATLLALTFVAGSRPLYGQMPGGTASEARLVGLGGSAFFLVPRLSMLTGRLRLDAEGVFSRGSSALTEGRTTLVYRLPWSGLLDASFAVTQRNHGVEEARDRQGQIGLRTRRLGAWLGLGSDQATTPGFGRATDTWSVRAWADLGAGVGLTFRRSAVREEGESMTDKTHIILGRYEFHTRRLSRYFREGFYAELEMDVSLEAGPAEVTLFGGHRFKDGEAPAAHWGFARVTLPLSERIDLLGEAGRNGGLPSVGRAPSDFARIGLRLDLRGSGGGGNGAFPSGASGRRDRAPTAPPPPAVPRAEVVAEGDAQSLVVIAPGARSIEVRGDFTDWRPRVLRETAPGRWMSPVRSGVHRLNIRIDGGTWTVPANLPVVPDEFTGAPVAVVVVR